MISHAAVAFGSLPEYERQTMHLALMGDDVAVQAVQDIIEERGINVQMFEVGKAYYIETLTFYYCGEVEAVYPTFVALKAASWVHWTGRKSELMKARSFDKKHFKGRSPRTEYIGTWKIPLQSVNGFDDWPISGLPGESIQ